MADKKADELVVAILRTVGARRGGGFSRPIVDGYTQEQIDAAVDELRRAGYLVAAHIEQAFGDNPAHWEPSELTKRGRELLQELESGR